jgi:hypothetical protein
MLEWMQNVGFAGDITEITVASSYGIKITQKYMDTIVTISKTTFYGMRQNI